MKKLVAFTLALALMLSLAACGGGSDTSNSENTTPPASQNGSETTDTASSNEGDSVDSSTVEGRLARAGLTLDDIKPDTFAEASLYNCDEDEIVMYITNEGGPLGEDVMKPLVMKVIEATAAVADDGKYWNVYYGLGEPTELDFSESNWDAWNFIAQWSYQKNSQWITVTLGVVPAEEPDGQDNYDYEVSLTFLY